MDRPSAKATGQSRRRIRGGYGAVIAVGLAMLAALVSGAGREAGAEDAPGTDRALVASIAAALPAEQRAELAFLERLGWRFARDPSVATVTVAPGKPCERESLEAAWAAGDLVIRVPAAMDAKAVSALGAGLSDLANGLGSRLAWRHTFGRAVREAARKLSIANERKTYVFPKIVFDINSPWFRCTLAEPEWGRDGRYTAAKAAPSKAIEAVYTKGGEAECYTGQWVMIWATLYELYGPEWFDREFRSQEIRLGTVEDMARTDWGKAFDEKTASPWRSLLLTPEDGKTDPGLSLAAHGPMAFVGVRGILQNEERVIASNQNFTIVSISPRAVAELKEHGGFWRVLELSRAANEARLASLRGFSQRARDEQRKRYEEILADPLFSEFMVYVQPFGVIPYAKIADKEMSEGNRPIMVTLYTDGIEDVIYQRYRAAWKARWLAAQSPPPGPGR